MKCPACGSGTPVALGTYRPYADYECTTYDCPACGSRFAPHDGTAHERLHATSGSTYDGQRALGTLVGDAYRRGDTARLRQVLGRSLKYRFVIDSVEALPDAHRILEVGCSRGFLTAYFIARGYDILGTDVATSAIAEAIRLFGEHFVVAGAEVVAEKGPYDAVVHVGTVGCVAHPQQFTEGLLQLLRPGGHLIFNAPNVVVCRTRDRLWGCSTPPPDLVTLFPPEYWHRFGNQADVQVTVSRMDAYDAIADRFRAMRQRWREPSLPRRMFDQPVSPVRRSARRDSTRRSARRLASLLSKACLVPLPPAEFGVHVVMTKGAD